MAFLQSDVNVHKLDSRMPFYKNMDHYLSMKSSCLYSYNDQPDVQKALRECSDYLTRHPAPQVIERAGNYDPEAVLELAIRYLSGCGVRQQSYDGALYMLDSFTDPSNERAQFARGVASSQLMAQAYSCAAEAQYRKFMATPAERVSIRADEQRYARPETARLGVGQSPFGYFSLAVHNANEAVKHGLVSPIVLLVGMKLREVGEKLGVDLDQMSRAKRFRPLWRAISRRLEEIYAEERKRQRKVARKPNEYVCAAEGCGIRGKNAAALRACGGRCPKDIKPSYCSKECQTKDWARHKLICKPSSAGKAPKVDDKVKAMELFELGEAEDADGEEDVVSEPEEHGHDDITLRDHIHQGPSHTIDIPAAVPGGSIQITSNTMDPELLRSIRGHLSKKMNDAGMSSKDKKFK